MEVAGATIWKPAVSSQAKRKTQNIAGEILSR